MMAARSHILAPGTPPAGTAIASPTPTASRPPPPPPGRPEGETKGDEGEKAEGGGEKDGERRWDEGDTEKGKE